MSKLAKPESGYLYIRHKDALSKISLINKGQYKEAFHIVVDPDNVEASLPASEVKPVEVVVPEPEKPKGKYSKEELAVMSFGKLRSLPEFAAIKDVSFRSKEEAIEALLKVPAGE